MGLIYATLGEHEAAVRFPILQLNSVPNRSTCAAFSTIANIYMEQH